MQDTFIQLSITCLCLQGVGHILGKISVKRLLFACLLFLIAYTQYYFYLVSSRELLSYETLFISYVPCLLFLGPLLRDYFNLLTKDNVLITIKHIPHYLLPLWGVYYYIAHIYLPNNQLKIRITNLYQGVSTDQYYPVSILCGLSLLFYALIILKEQPKIFSRDSFLNKPLLLGWWILNIIFISFMTASIFSITTAITLSFISNYVASILFTSIFIVNLRYPNFFRLWLFEIKKRNRSRQYLGTINPETMLSKIKERMNSDQLYANPELSLQILANHVALTRYQLSELLNTHAKMSFHEFVGNYRIDAAKEMLKKYPWKKLSVIGYDVGFNSQTMFIKTFKKWEKKTPSEYQKSVQN